MSPSPRSRRRSRGARPPCPRAPPVLLVEPQEGVAERRGGVVEVVGREDERDRARAARGRGSPRGAGSGAAAGARGRSPSLPARKAKRAGKRHCASESSSATGRASKNAAQGRLELGARVGLAAERAEEGDPVDLALRAALRVRRQWPSRIQPGPPRAGAARAGDELVEVGGIGRRRARRPPRRRETGGARRARAHRAPVYHRTRSALDAAAAERGSAWSVFRIAAVTSSLVALSVGKMAEALLERRADRRSPRRR